MSKVSVSITNKYCPQTLFLYGTYKEDGSPNFGLFCWASYYWDAELGFMACIGGDKLTKDRIRANKIFSANLVTEKLLPLADYFGNKEGYEEDKMDIAVAVEPGKVLKVPVLTDSPVTFELEVSKSILLDDAEVFLCKIRNVLHDETLTQNTHSLVERMRAVAPVSTSFNTYFAWDGTSLGDWGAINK